jgi:NADPH-dependent curcumin reductase CurA
MKIIESREIRLACRPKGIPTAANFACARTELTALPDQMVLVRNLFMSVDHCLRWHFRLQPRKATPRPIQSIQHHDQTANDARVDCE